MNQRDEEPAFSALSSLPGSMQSPGHVVRLLTTVDRRLRKWRRGSRIADRGAEETQASKCRTTFSVMACREWRGASRVTLIGSESRNRQPTERPISVNALELRMI